MKTRKELKKTAQKTMKQHYFRNVILVFLCTCLLAGGVRYTTKNILNISIQDTKVNQLINHSKLSNSEIIDEILQKSTKEKKIEQTLQNKYTNGVLSYLINATTSSRSFVFVILNGINQFIFEDKIALGVIIILSTIVVAILEVIFVDTLEVGKKRYFLEQRCYYDTKFDRLLFPYKVKKTCHIAFILLKKKLLEFLWSFTIVGGFIKHYEYSMIPYLLAENPKMSSKDAFRLSKELTMGNKWYLFTIDISMLGWSLLRLLTFNLSGIFFSDVYYEVIFAEVYMNLRSKALDCHTIHLLSDHLLEVEPKEATYPEENYIVPARKWLQVDYRKDYSVTTYILFFFTFAMIGWVWEVVLHLLNTGTFVNRGTMYGPWLPIYGFGGVLILILLRKFRDQPFQLFIAAFILCGILEYSTAWYLETFKHLKYWDYTGYFLNIQGRICLEGLLVFGLGGCGFTYIVAPLLDNLYQKIPKNITNIICVLLLSLYFIDLAYTKVHPNTGQGISKPVAESVLQTTKKV